MPIDELEDYLFGRLTPAAGRRFEARLTQDTGLRRHIREFEEGALALAMATPQLRPPTEAWTNIQAGIARERQADFLWPVLPLHWLFRGWSLAGGLAVAVLIYFTAVHVSAPARHAATAGTAGKQTDKTATVAPPDETQFAGRENSNALNSMATAKEAKAGSLARIQAGIGAPAKDQASPEIDATTLGETMGTNASRQSPRLQSARLHEAVLLAMTHRTGSTNSPAAQAQPLAETPTQVQVDYMEFPNPIVAATAGFTQSGFGIGPTSAGATPALGTPGTLSGDLSESVFMFPSGNDLAIGIDSATLPANIGPVTIWVEDLGGIPIVVGTVNPGVNPMVINIQNAGLGAGFYYIVTAGGSNVLGHFP
jgi:hypothetical protein